MEQIVKQHIWFLQLPPSMGGYESHYLWQSDSYKLNQLGQYLSDEARVDNDISWLLDPKIPYKNGIESYIYKEDDNNSLLTISWLNEDDPFRIKTSTFYQILSTWNTIYPLKPDRIDLFEENGKYTFEYDSVGGHQKIIIE